MLKCLVDSAKLFSSHFQIVNSTSPMLHCQIVNSTIASFTLLTFQLDFFFQAAQMLFKLLKTTFLKLYVLIKLIPWSPTSSFFSFFPL